MYYSDTINHANDTFIMRIIIHKIKINYLWILRGFLHSISIYNFIVEICQEFICSSVITNEGFFVTILSYTLAVCSNLDMSLSVWWTYSYLSYCGGYVNSDLCSSSVMITVICIHQVLLLSCVGSARAAWITWTWRQRRSTGESQITIIQYTKVSV